MTKKKPKKTEYIVVFNAGMSTCVLAVHGATLLEAFEEYKEKTEEAFGICPGPVFFGAGSLGDNLIESLYPQYLQPGKIN